MRKITALFLIFFITSNVAGAINIGTYKAETEYGLWDGFKFNFGKREEGRKFIELKSETPEEKARLERQKLKPKEEQDEYQLFRFMREDTVIF